MLQSLTPIPDGPNTGMGTPSTGMGTPSTGMGTPSTGMGTPSYPGVGTGTTSYCVHDNDNDHDQDNDRMDSDNDQDNDDQGQSSSYGYSHGGSSGMHQCNTMGENEMGENSNHQGDNACDYDDKHSEAYVACILDGPGKSLKLGMLTTDLQGVNSVAEVVCVTEQECLGPVAKYFHVQGAYERGYCEGNPNVQRLTDAQVNMILSTMQPLK